jgi:hypothetical protein
MTHAKAGQAQNLSVRSWTPLARLAGVLAAIASLTSLTPSWAQQEFPPAQVPVPANPGAPAMGQVSRPLPPVVLTARNSNPAAAASNHPLNPALDLAYAALERANAIRDCSFTFVRREEIDGELTDHDYMFMKVRNEPFSVYIYCHGPVTPKAQEAIFIDGRNDGKAWAHPTGLLNKIVGTISLLPTGPRMMEGNRYPMTDAGPVKMLKKLIEHHEEERKYGECDVRITPGVKVDARDCTCVQVIHPTRRQNFSFHKVCIFYDNEMKLPIRWEAYDWPRETSGDPPLVEEYTYRELKFNPGLTDVDFDINNPAYNFKRK